MRSDEKAKLAADTVSRAVSAAMMTVKSITIRTF